MGFWAELGIDQPAPDIDYWDVHLRPKTFFLEAPTGELAAYALTFPFGARGDVRQIVVGPAYRRRGIGQQLLAEVAGRFRAAGVRDWRLEVRADNAPAIALYRSVGMTVLREIHTVRVTREVAARFAATRSGTLQVQIVDPADDAVLEERFDYGRGQLARWRTARGADAALWRIGTEALAQYMPQFAPAWGLLFPLRASDADHAAHLFAAVVDRGMREEIEMLVADPPVIEALAAAGSRHVETMYEMAGPIPSAP